MSLVDSHCHLDRIDLTAYPEGLSGAIRAAKEMGVSHFLSVSVDVENFPQILAIGNQFENISVSVGLHPTEEVTHEPTPETFITLARDPKVVAIGETGLDYYRCEGDMSWQQNRFRHHIQAAKTVRKPLIIHSRMAREDTIQILQDEQASDIGGVLHCFTESWDMAVQAMALGFYISISGIVTFKNATELQDVAKKVPLDMLLVETDSPYLAPVPHRGKSNEPAYVRYVAEFIAELRGVSYETIAKHTTDNFYRLFSSAKNTSI